MNSFILDYLEQFFDELSPLEFYRDIFPKGELQVSHEKKVGKYCAIAVELLSQESEDKKNVKRYLIHDDLEQVKRLLDSDNFIIISPISYAGRSRTAENARFIYALAIDLDGITKQEHVRDFFHQIKIEHIPKPSYIVFSGSGIHLYYKFIKPIPCFKNITKQLARLKKELTRKIWNGYVTELFNNVQYESLFQGFRIAGGVAKDGSRTRVFRTGEAIDIEYLNSFVLEEYRVTDYVYKSKLTLAEASEKYPEWYENRVIKGMPRNSWVCKRELFEWWKCKVKEGVKVGHRYYCVMVLAIYAKKCGISREELEEYAFSIVNELEELTEEEENHFTRADVLAALEMYNDNYIRFPIDSIVSLTDISIEKNKRNYRPQKEHLKIARFTRQVMQEMGQNVSGGGRPDRKREVVEWRERNPNGTKSECARELGMSRTTVYKHWV